MLALEDAQRHDVDERVLGVAVGELDLPAEGGDTDGVAVARNAAHDTAQQVAVAGVVERAESDRVPHRDGPGAHGEDVAQDAAHAGGGALVRLDEGRVVVALDPQRRQPAVAEVDDAGVLAGADDHPRRLGREPAEMSARRLVRAVLGPHHRVHRQLGGPGLPPEDGDDGVVLVVGHAEPAVGGFGHGASAGTEARNERSRTRPSADPSTGSLARSG